MLRLDAVYVERNSLRDAVATEKGLSPQNLLLGKVELIEPTFQVKKPILCFLYFLFPPSWSWCGMRWPLGRG